MTRLRVGKARYIPVGYLESVKCFSSVAAPPPIFSIQPMGSFGA